MSDLQGILNYNRKWAKDKLSQNPNFFANLAKGQTPKYLWIGCSDSRVSPTLITGLNLGDIFVHQNVANLVIHTDLNLLSVLQYAVEVLEVQDIIVCGHYGCGGVRASMGIKPHGLADNWIRNIRDVFIKNKNELRALHDLDQRANRLVELNVNSQVLHICYTNIIQNAWLKHKKLTIHGWVFDLKSGYIKNLNCSISGPKDIDEVYHLDMNV